MKTAYQYKHFLRDFTEEEALDGLELALSNPEGINSSKASADDQRQNDMIYHRDTHICLLTTETDNAHYIDTIYCQALVDETHGELIHTRCKCSTFQKNHYACKHVAALLAGYLILHYGTSIFRDSPLADKLKAKTGLPDPFLPGVLKATDQQLLKLLDAHKKTDLLPAASTADTYTIECSSQPEGNGLSIELKFGSRRKYVVKDVPNLIHSIMRHLPYTLGKVTADIGMEQLDAPSRRLMRFLIDLYNGEEQSYYSSVFTFSGNSSYRRYICLSGRNLDAFMELYSGVPFSYQGDSVVFDPDLNNPGITLAKQNFGALLSAPSSRRICSTMDWLYFQHMGQIGRLRREEGSTAAELLELLSAKPELYIRQTELPALFSRLLPGLEKQLPVSYQGIAPEDYRPEIPKFRLYLDLPQDNMISCQVHCIYDRLHQDFLLYDDAQADSRNLSEENIMRQAINNYFDAFNEADKSMCLLCDDNRLYQFLMFDIPELSRLGEVFVSDALKKLKVRPMPTVAVGIQLDGLMLRMSLSSSDMDMNELSELLSAYNRKKTFHRLKNGSFITLDPSQADAWATLSETWLQYGKKHLDDISVPMFRALYLDEMLKNRDQIHINANRRYRQLILNMDLAKDTEDSVPESLASLLRPYQVDGYHWIHTLKQCGFGGILADDMGLGKTLQTLTFLLSEKESGKSGDELRTLIITPASLVYNWQKEILQFTPGLTCKVISGSVSERRELLSQATGTDPALDADVWITSYDLLKRDMVEYEHLTFANQIIDEAQYIKNHNTQASKSVRLVHSGFRLALTGTPIENRLSELWSIFDFLMPGFLLGYQGFRETYEEAVVRAEDSEAADRLRALVHPFILRRLKRDVLQELPEKVEKSISVRLEGEQRKLYDAYAQRLRMFLAKQTPDEFRQNKLELLRELTRLRQLCCGPSLFLENYKGENAKLSTCLELVKQAIDGGHKLLLFSQFTSVLDEVEKAFRKENIASLRIDGSVSKEERMRRVDAFNQTDIPVFCISLKAGGTGLNLTAADIVIHFDPWWNVAAQNQATDRAHRIGQENTVMVYELIAENTIEEQIQKLQKSKQDLAEEILSGESISSILIDRDEILKLL